MAENNFDAYAETYRQTLDDAVAIGGGDSAYYAERKIVTLKSFYKMRSRSSPTAILDFGCGTGTNLPFLRQLFADATLHGVDVSGRSLELARKRKISDCHLRTYDGHALPYGPGVFDLVVVSNVLHHIKPLARPSALQVISRCMKPGGLIAVFEHNPNNPLTRKVVRDCPFDAGVVLVKPSDIQSALSGLGYQIVDAWNIIFFPAALKTLNVVEPSLRWLPFGAQYAVFGEWRGK